MPVGWEPVAEDVGAGVAFGLRSAGASKAETTERVGGALEMVRLGAWGKRRPAQLSGGQQQRVALARALVLKPAVLLLDEPLGALDAKLRKELRLEMQTRQGTVGITFVYVTHDQEEALTMSDRLAVMADGRIEQVGSPEDVYQSPATAYVAGFLSAANVLKVDVLGPDGGGVACRLGGQTIKASGTCPAGPATIVIRPERVSLAPAGADDPPADVLAGTVERVTFLGPTTHIVVSLDGDGSLLVAVPHAAGPASLSFPVGLAVWASVLPEAARLVAG